MLCSTSVSTTRLKTSTASCWSSAVAKVRHFMHFVSHAEYLLSISPLGYYYNRGELPV